MLKWSRDLYMAVANLVQECWAGFRHELDAMGVLPPCGKLSPIEPPLRMDEYHMMQRDKTKCKYHFALSMPFLRIVFSSNHSVPSCGVCRLTLPCCHQRSNGIPSHAAQSLCYRPTTAGWCADSAPRSTTWCE